MAGTTQTTKAEGSPRAEATKERILEAASEEFAALGLAGARVDRVAERAAVNKRMIYLYFGNKEELFDAVLDAHLSVVTEGVPFSPDDLPAYAGDLFDLIVANPRALRLTSWRNFERAGPTEADLAAYAAKLKAIRAAQRRGTIDRALAPEDVLALLMGMVTSWLAAAPALKELASGAPDSPTRLKRHRRALLEAVERTFRPGGSSAAEG